MPSLVRMNGLISASEASIGSLALASAIIAAAAAFATGAGNADAERQLARLKRLQADAGLDGLFQNPLGRLGGDLFDLHAAVGRRHEHVLAGGAVEHDAEIKFALDGQRLFDQQPLHHAAFGSGLVRDQRHAQDLFGERRALRRRPWRPSRRRPCRVRRRESAP